MRLNLDGMYFRVERNGQYTNVCFSDLEQDEMDECLERYGKEQTIEIIKHLFDCAIEMSKQELSISETKYLCKNVATFLHYLGETLGIQGDSFEYDYNRVNLDEVVADETEE